MINYLSTSFQMGYDIGVMILLMTCLHWKRPGPAIDHDFVRKLHSIYINVYYCFPTFGIFLILTYTYCLFLLSIFLQK
jgi:hypothetical protein